MRGRRRILRSIVRGRCIIERKISLRIVSRYWEVIIRRLRRRSKSSNKISKLISSNAKELSRR